jgi:glycosyltransferase involved in cell wall biosynthesis
MNRLKKLGLISLLVLGINLSSISSSQPGDKPPAMWSILICTLEERKATFRKLYRELKKQIAENNLVGQVEIRAFCDNRKYTVGFKRNALLKASKGKYVCYIDDDDWVHEKYVSMIFEKLQKNPDCVSLKGIITTNGKNPRLFIHSNAYKEWFERDGIYYRSPNHLNPIRRDIAMLCKFPETNAGEDHAWSMALARSGLLKKEEIIDEPYYFYLFDERK